MYVNCKFCNICVSGKILETAWRATLSRQATHADHEYSWVLARNRLAESYVSLGDASLFTQLWVSDNVVVKRSN